METPEVLGLIAGSGVYPLLLADAARVAGVKKIIVAAFTDETSVEITNRADEIEWLRVGQLGRLLNFFRAANVRHALMAGQIAPGNLFSLRPDFKTMFLLARLKERNAESIFGAIADQLAEIGAELLPATTFLEHLLAPAGHIAGPKLKEREEADVTFGFEIAKQLSALNVGQTIVVKNGTVLAVEAFEGTNEAIKRGGSLGKKNAIVVKVTKPKQDMRFDVPVIGLETLRVAAEAKIRAIAVEAGCTLLLERAALVDLADRSKISLVGR
ncbi:MAG: LpxI family protein [Chthoniobacterales bacterium]|nr:LpxI family protein [Chthoniobacterales bacterium]